MLWDMESSQCGFLRGKSQGTGLWSCWQGQHTAKAWHREEGMHQSHAKAAPRKICGRTYGVFLNAPITFI